MESKAKIGLKSQVISIEHNNRAESKSIDIIFNADLREIAHSYSLRAHPKPVTKYQVAYTSATPRTSPSRKRKRSQPQSHHGQSSHLSQPYKINKINLNGNKLATVTLQNASDKE